MRGALATLGAGGWMDLAEAGMEDPCAAAEAAGRELQGINPGRGSSSLPGSARGSAATTMGGRCSGHRQCQFSRRCLLGLRLLQL